VGGPKNADSTILTPAVPAGSPIKVDNMLGTFGIADEQWGDRGEVLPVCLGAVRLRPADVQSGRTAKGRAGYEISWPSRQCGI